MEVVLIETVQSKYSVSDSTYNGIVKHLKIINNFANITHIHTWLGCTTILSGLQPSFKQHLCCVCSFMYDWPTGF